MTSLIISVSGLRGIVGESLTPEVAVRYVAAFAASLPPGPIVVARDGRTTGPMLAQAVQAALAGSGRRALYLDVAATPTVGVMVRQLKATGGVQISASHNPPPYNGIKLFDAAGRVIPAAAGAKVKAAYEQGATAWAKFDAVGSIESVPDTVGPHLQAVLGTIDPAPIRAKRFRVLLDANHGAGAILGRRLLEALGCETTILGEEPHGKFWHPPEPTEANLAAVREKVVATGAAVGFCQDPDADRLALIDERGEYIGEEYTLALCVDHILSERRGAIVTNCATSRMSQDLAERRGVPFRRSAVGDANVVDAMLACGAVFGGEGNGGPIDPRVGLVRDSFVGMALVLASLSRQAQPLSQLAAALPRYEIRKTTIDLASGKLPAALEAVERHFSDAIADRLDGLRLDWPDKWLIVRGSNTEPIVRAIAEAKSAAAAEQLCQEAAEVIGRVK
jgi:phosphomannomutase